MDSKHVFTEEYVGIRLSEILKVNIFSRPLLEQNCMQGSLSIENISFSRNEEQIISGCPIDGAISVRMDSRFGSYRWFVYITTPLLRDASWILILHCGTPESAQRRI